MVVSTMFARRNDDAIDHDPLLEPLLQAGDERERDAAIERLLVAHAEPLIDRIVASSSRSEAFADRDREDIRATVVLRLLQKLRMLARGETAAIGRFEDYLAVLTHNAVNDHLRRRYPRLTSLKNQLRYLLRRDARFALWTQGDELVAGLAAWRMRSAVLREPPELAPTAAMLDMQDKAGALAAVLHAAGAPIVLQALVRLVARLWRISDSEPAEPVSPVDRKPPATQQFEAREYLRALWREIAALGPNHRKALLLNLRDDETVNVVSIFVASGVVPFEQLAAALELEPRRLAELWNELPLDDHRIAAMLGITRQQVINLRKSARKRLERKR
jgi:hypothetical protein